MISLRRLLARHLLGLQLPLVGLLLVLLGWGSRVVMLDLAQRDGADRLRLAVADLDAHLSSLERAGAQVATYLEQGRLSLADPAAGTTLLMPWLAAQREAPLVNLVDEAGCSLLLIRNEGVWRAREIRRDRSGHLELRWRTVGPTGREQEDLPHDRALTYDPRRRGWYQEARSVASPRWSTPYRLDPPESRLVLTWLVPVPARGSAPAGAIGVDLPAADFEHFLNGLRPTPGSRLWVVDADGAVLASTPAAGTAPAPLAPAESARIQGHTHRLLSQDLPSHAGARWRLMLAIPERDLLDQVFWRLAILLGAAGLLLVVPFLWSLALARRITAEVGRLAWVASGIGKGHPPTGTTHAVTEFQTLSEALVQAHADQEERLRLERQLQQHQRHETMGTLAGGVAHHVNNHLSAILGRVGLARETLPPGHPAAPHLLAAEEASQSCARIVSALMAFGRPAAPTLEPLDANALLRDLVPLLRPLMGDGYTVVLGLSPELPQVRADILQLEQVLVNLVLNARDAMPEGGTVSLRTAPTPEGGVKITVQDAGSGIAPESLDRIFEPFYTTKPVGKGAGLGLSLAQGILQAHGGRIDVEATSTSGTTLSLVLPPPG